jgi:hypothetical protein
MAWIHRLRRPALGPAYARARRAAALALLFVAVTSGSACGSGASDAPEPRGAFPEPDLDVLVVDVGGAIEVIGSARTADDCPWRVKELVLRDDQGNEWAALFEEPRAVWMSSVGEPQDTGNSNMAMGYAPTPERTIHARVEGEPRRFVLEAQCVAFLDGLHSATFTTSGKEESYTADPSAAEDFEATANARVLWHMERGGLPLVAYRVRAPAPGWSVHIDITDQDGDPITPPRAQGVSAEELAGCLLLDEPITELRVLSRAEGPGPDGKPMIWTQSEPLVLPVAATKATGTREPSGR